MSVKNRLLIVGSSIAVAFLIGLSWVSPAFAAGGVGDGDGVDGDELLWPFVLGGLLVVGLIALVTYFVMQRRSRSQL